MKTSRKSDFNNYNELYTHFTFAHNKWIRFVQEVNDLTFFFSGESSLLSSNSSNPSEKSSSDCGKSGRIMSWERMGRGKESEYRESRRDR